MKKHMKSAVVLVLCVSMMVGICGQTSVYATQSEAGEAQDNLDATNEKIDDLQQEQQERKESLDDYNEDLSQVSQDVVEVEQQIADKQTQIEETQTALAAAEDLAEIQYGAMKKRIVYIYQNGSDSYLAILLESKNFSEFLNRAEYVMAIQQYDREMLGKYQELCKDIEEKKVTLQDEMNELEVLQQQSENKQSRLSELVASTKSDISTAQDEIDEQIAKADEYEKQIEDAKLAEAQALAEQLAKEAAAKAAEKAAQEAAEKEAAEQEAAENGQTSDGENASENTTPAEDTIENNYTETAGDVELMASIIYCEAGGESYEGQLAVGSVVMNRVNSGSFPNSVSEVIYQSGQFSPVASGKFALVLSSGKYSSSSLSAAKEVLNGNITVNFLYFHSASGWTSEYGTYIGNQVFY